MDKRTKTTRIIIRYLVLVAIFFDLLEGFEIINNGGISNYQIATKNDSVNKDTIFKVSNYTLTKAKVSKGDRVKITSSGNITFVGTGTVTGPEGLKSGCLNFSLIVI